MFFLRIRIPLKVKKNKYKLSCMLKVSFWMRYGMFISSNNPHLTDTFCEIVYVQPQFLRWYQSLSKVWLFTIRFLLSDHLEIPHMSNSRCEGVLKVSHWMIYGPSSDNMFISGSSPYITSCMVVLRPTTNSNKNIFAFSEICISATGTQMNF